MLESWSILKQSTPILILLLLCCSAVFSASLTYDRATGNLDGFAVNIADSPNYPGGYTNATEVWSKSGFIGRLLYLGEPCTFTFSNIGPVASYTSNNRFYFTLNNDGTPNTGVWREFFLVTRAKGITHGGSQHDFSSINSVIANNSGSFLLNVGAGTELASVGEVGYDTNRNSGVYTGTNAFRYKYPYSAIWIDVTLIRTTSARSSTTRGYYESHIQITTGGGLSQTLYLGGMYNPRSSHTEPNAYAFSIEELYTSAFPFSELENRNSVAASMEVATIKYVSHVDQAEISIASNAAGTAAAFYFTTSDGLYFPFRVAYDAVTPNLSPVEITPASNTFTTVSTTVASPVGGSYTANRLEGKIKLFVPVNTNPAEGLYSSTIYILVTQID